MTEQITIEPELWDLIPEYLERRRTDVVRLREALDGDDLGTVRRLGHNLRGSGASYGFSRISQLGRSLEQAASEHDTAVARARIEELATHLDAIEPVRGAS